MTVFTAFNAHKCIKYNGLKQHDSELLLSNYKIYKKIIKGDMFIMFYKKYRYIISNIVI